MTVMGASGQLFYGELGYGNNDVQVVRVNSDGTGTTVVVEDNPDANIPGVYISDIGLDTAGGFYFAIVGDGNYAQAMLVRGSLSGGAQTVLARFDNNTLNSDGDDDLVSALYVDPIAHKIYVGDDSATGADPTKGGIKVYTYDPATGALTGNTAGTFIVTEATSGKGKEGGAYTLAPLDFALDKVNNQLYFTETLSGTSGKTATGLFRLDLNNPGAMGAVTQVVAQSMFPDDLSNGVFSNVEVDPRGYVYFSVHEPGSSTTNYAIDAIWSVALGSTNGTATKIAISGYSGAATFRPDSLKFDPTTNELYVENTQYDGNGSTSTDSIVVFTMSADGHTATYARTITPAAVTGNTGNLSAFAFNHFATVAVTGSGVAAVEQSNPVTVFNGTPAISDSDGGYLRSATVQITANGQTGDVLAGNNAGTSAITVAAYNATTGTLTFSGYATLAQYQNALATVTFQTTGNDNPTSYDTATTRTLTTTVNDSTVAAPGGSNNTTTTMLTVTGVNDAPTIGNLDNDSIAAVANGSAYILDSGSNATVTDMDSANFSGGSLTVTVTNAQSGDSTGVAQAGGITSTSTTVLYNGTQIATFTGSGAASQTYTFNPSATPAAVQALIHELTFSSTSTVSGTRTISYSLNDGDGTANNGASTTTVSSSVALTTPNVEPTGTNATLTATEDTARVLSFTEFGTADSDGTVTGIRFTTLPGNGTLYIDVDGAGTGSLGTAITAGQTVLKSVFDANQVVFVPTANSNGTSGFMFAAQDNQGAYDSSPNTITLTIAPVADTPTVTNATTNEDTQSTTGLVVTRNAVDGSEITYVQITNITNGTLYLADGISAVANGSFITYAQAHAGLKFTPAVDFNGAGSFQAQASTSNTSAGLGGSPVTATITVNPVNDAPVVNASGTTAFTEGADVASVPVVVAPTATITDPDSPMLNSARVSITGNFAAGDMLAFTNSGAATYGNIAATYDSATGVLMLTSANATATIAQFQAALRAVTFTTNSDTPSVADRTVSFVVNDGSVSGPISTHTVTVAPANDSPVNTVATQTIGEDADATVLTGLAIADPDAGTGTVTTTLTVPTAVGSFGVTGTPSGTVTINSSGSAATLVGTIAQVNATLNGHITFTPATNVNGSFAITMTTNDGGNTGGAAKTDIDTVPIMITAVNDAPVLGAPTSTTVGFAENAASPTTLFAGTTLTDVDAPATYQGGSIMLTGGRDGGFVLAAGSAFTTVTNGGVIQLVLRADTSVVLGAITGYGTTNLAITGLTANATFARIQDLVDGDFAYINASGNPTTGSYTLTLTVNDGGNTGSGGAANGSVAQTLVVTATDDFPVAVNDFNNIVAENATVTIAVLSNDADDDGRPKTVAAIDGNAIAAGQTVTLASGATATLSSSGIITYDPHGAYNYLVSTQTAATTGAVDTSAVDSFTYSLNGGSAAMVTVTVTGVDGPDDQLRGDGGDNSIHGTPQHDYIDVSQGGVDIVAGGAGNDSIYLGAALTAADRIDGGAGISDQVGLRGDYTGSHPLVLGPTTLTNVEVLALLPGGASPYSYDITSNDATVAAGEVFTVFATNLAAGENLKFNGAAEIDGSFLMFGGLGTDTLIGGANSDSFYFGPDRFGPNDVVHGSGGMDQLGLDGHNGALTLDAAHTDVEVLALLKGNASGTANAYGTITIDDSWVAAGQTKTITAVTAFGNSTGPVATALTIDGSGESNGNLNIYGGTADDVLTAGGGTDHLFGGLGADTLRGGAGADVILYNSAAESTGLGFDTLADFVYGEDRISIAGQGSDVYASVSQGTLTRGNFDADLQAAVGSQLSPGHAVFFSPTAGDFIGQTFLIVDANGAAGYQNGGDYVFHMAAAPALPVGPAEFIVA